MIYDAILDADASVIGVDVVVVILMSLLSSSLLLFVFIMVSFINALHFFGLSKHIILNL
jgi:hypothetical protein